MHQRSTDAHVLPIIHDCHVAPPGPEGGRVVLVQADGTDEAREALRDTLLRRGAAARGVTQVSLVTAEATLEQMNLAGVCGLRLVLPPDAGGQAARTEFDDHVARARQRGWHLELDASPAVVAGLAHAIRAQPTAVVLSGVRPGLGLAQDGLGAVLELLAAGQVWIKLSATDASSLPVLRAMIATNPDRLVWGSCWPRSQPDQSLTLLMQAGAEPVLRRILHDNAVELYGFDAASLR